MAIVEIRPDAWYSVLQVDGMHFSAAQRSLNRAKRAFPAVRSARDVAAETQAEITELLDREKENERSYYEDIEPLAIKAEGQDTDLAAAYAPYLEAIASVHILAAASAEAHINDRSKSRLAGRYWREFEQLSLEAKWLLFPRIVGLGELDAGAEPLQGLARLVRRRNVLVHYKPKRDYWEPPGVPLFLDNLGFTTQAGRGTLR